MGIDDYSRLKRILNLSTAADWLYEDSKDDFFPDSFMFRDIRDRKDEYLEQRQHRILQIDVIPSIMEYSPKANRMLREAIWLHPTHRILYLSILHHLLPKLDKLIPPTIYSYRLDKPDDPDAYPFPNRSDRWKQFHNDFRSAALDESTKAVLLTDLASFYDHISIENLTQRITSMLGRSIDADTSSVVSFLNDLLNLWSKTGHGIPQNLDPSSFFGSLYLYNADLDMLGKRYRYFRWVDDIRICAKSHDQAVRALHDLQRILAHDRLFLSSDKTKIIEKESDAFNKLMDVEDDVIISQAEEEIATGYADKLKETSNILLGRIIQHAAVGGDDRKFRAYANRLLSIAEFEEIKEQIHPEIRRLVIPRLRTHPSRSDYWMKMLFSVTNENVMDALKDLLITQPSLFDWQRFHAWRMLTHSNEISKELFECAKTTARVGVSVLEQAQAIVCIGKHGTNQDRETLFAEMFSAQSPYPVQRAIITAIQELPDNLRERLFERVTQLNSDHNHFIKFIQGREKINYGERPRPTRHCKEEPRGIRVFLKSGVGLVHGKRTNFRLSRSHYDYE
jgi:hypothetical protein